MISTTTAILSVLLATVPFASTAAVPATSRVPYNIANPGATPTYKTPSLPSILPSSVVNAYMNNAAVRQRQKREALALDDSVDVNLGLYGRSIGDTVKSKFWGKRKTTRSTATTTETCVDSTANDTIINSLLYYGGAGYTLSLCPGATIYLNDTIFFYNVGQEISTQGLPSGSDRATLVVNGTDQSMAIIGSCDLCQNIILRNVIVHGSRDTLGWLSDGGALIELGGNTNGQIIDNIWSYEPRGWSALHGIEGYELYCSNMTITNNQIGPSGHSPTNGAQFRRRDTYAPGEWADGISLACKGSSVYGNTITDATDGAIVIFGAVGSMVHDNTIIADTRNLLGGINMVDYLPFEGTFEGTQVYSNTLNANTAMIKIGIALGSMSWGSDNRTASRTYGGLVQDNTFMSGSMSGYFGYASSIAGHDNATVINNIATTANFGGSPSDSCIPSPMVPSAQAFVYDPETAPSATIQNNFNPYSLVFLICNQPGSVLVTGPSAPLSSISSSASMSSTSSIASSSSVSSSASVTTSSAAASISSASAAAASSASVASASSASVASVSSASVASVSSASVASMSSASKAAASSSAAVVAAAAGRHPVSLLSSVVSSAAGRVPTVLSRVPLKIGAVVVASRDPLLVGRNFVPLVGDAELLEERDAWIGGPTPTASNTAPTFPPQI